MRVLLLSISLLISSFTVGQGYYQNNKSELYFFSLGSGLGLNTWHSVAKDYKLFTPFGRKILDGDSKMKANTQSDLYEMQIIFPMQGARLGFGLCFERFTLLELDILDQTTTSVHGFPEVFRFDKIFFQVEKPFAENNSGKFNLFASMGAGYYSLSMLNSTSLFGDSRWGNTWCTMGKFGFELRLFDKIFANMGLLGDYKFFNNSKKELPQNITHHIFTYGFMGSLRVAFR